MLAKKIEKNWYKPWWHNAWLLPLWLLSASYIHLKRRQQLAKTRMKSPVPVVVVGNINVGGTGKTPLIIHLVQRALALGLKPAVVSRGYGGSSKEYPLLVTAETPASLVGDEPKLIFERLGCTVVVAPKRSEAVAMAGRRGADIIFSDDGLQHYAMNRDAEIIVVDGQRKFGNGWLLPIGPLREPLSRLYSADLVLVNGKDFIVRPSKVLHLKTGRPAKIESVAGKKVDAVCGLGNPQRFYQTLQKLGVQVQERTFPDHHAYTAADFNFAEANKIVIMTEKDAVKCRDFAQNHWWYLTVNAVLSKGAAARIDRLLIRLGKQHG